MRRILPTSALLGALVWLGIAAARGWASFETLFLAAPLVVVPLALALGPTEHRVHGAPRLMRVAAWLQPPAALALVASFLAAPPGPLAGALAVPWLALALLLGVHGAGRFLARGPGPAEELAVDAALVYAPVGGAWLAASRLGLSPMGFREPIVLLTAVHFHFAAFALLVLAGALGRRMMPARSEPAYRVAVAMLVAGPILLALGITLSRALEVAAAGVMAAGVLLLFALATTWRRVFAAPALAALLPMGAAVLYATRGLDLALMARVHGAVNVGILLFGLVTLHVIPEERAPRAPRGGIPFSRLRSRRTTGPTFFEREGLVVERATRPTGLVDDLRHYARPDFDPEKVAPAIRAFYERTDEHALVVRPRWRRGFRALGHAYGRYARTTSQMRFPMREQGAGERIRSVILAVDDRADGRTNVRAWVRTYVDTGEPAYVAAYSTHEERGQTYMNIAFPFPGWNLTSVLRLEPYRENGVLLTSRATPTTWGDQGVYAVGKGWRLRMPINETIAVWTDDGATVLARHDMSFLGARFLTLEYTITRDALAGEARSSAGVATGRRT